MALKYVGKLITDTKVFAMSAGITTTTYNVQKKSALAVTKNDGEKILYIVQAGTPVPSMTRIVSESFSRIGTSQTTVALFPSPLVELLMR